MSDVDTSRERVEGLARVHDIGAQSYGDDNDAGLIALAATTAATLRALLAERDAAREECDELKADLLAENDAVRFAEDFARAQVSAAYARGAEAMRERAAEMVTAIANGDHEIWRRENGGLALTSVIVLDLLPDAIRDLPLPDPEDK
jgi:hypothetical protein